MKSEERQTIRLVISGRVQGVGYRAWIAKETRRLGITGWVKNREDGSVEIVATGTHAMLSSLVRLAWKGPMLTVVDSVETRPLELQDFPQFRVIQ